MARRFASAALFLTLVRLLVVAVGKVKERGLRDVLDEYYARVRRHVACEEIEVRDGRDVSSALRAAIPERSVIVALEVDGVQLTSEELSTKVVRWGSTGNGVVAFVIGGADGIPKEFSKKADVRWSLSKLTFAHRVARVVLAEQLYRAISIWRGEPYHRA